MRGAVVVDEPVPAGACTYRLVGTDAGLPLDVRGPPTPLGGIDPAVPVERVPGDPAAVAGPASARVVAERDGVEVGRWEGERLPDVDVLLSSLHQRRQRRRARGVAARGRRVDRVPTPAKTVLTAVLGLALLATVVLLVLADRGPGGGPSPQPSAGGQRARPAGAARRRRRGPAALVDLAVVGVLALWTFVAPATDDDGYFSLQARNAALTGTVGDYVQFQNRSFTPFTWPYQALAEWQQWAGTAPVLLRVPAAVCGLLTWVAVRALIRPVAVSPASISPASISPASISPASIAQRRSAQRRSPGRRAGGRGRRVPRLVAAVRHGGAPGTGGRAVRHRGGRAAPARGGAAAARASPGSPWPSRGQAPSPTPAGSCCSACWWRAFRCWFRCCAATPAPSPVRADPRVRVPLPVLRGVAVASALATALLLGFADGALRDFLRGQAVTGAVFTPDGWADEAGRYAFLLDPIPMGSFARRAAVLTCLLALAWFAVLAVAARARRPRSRPRSC